MRRVVVARWGYDLGEVVLSLFEGDPWTRVAEQQFVFGSSNDPVGFSALDETSFLACYGAGSGPETFYLERITVDGGFTRGAPHVLMSGTRPTDVMPYYTPLWIAGDNGGEGRAGGTGARSTDGTLLVNVSRSGNFPALTYYLDVFSLTADGETALLARHPWPNHTTVLALAERTFLYWVWSTNAIGVIQVNSDGTYSTLATGTMPTTDGYAPASVFWLPGANKIVGTYPNVTFGPDTGVAVADPSDLVFGSITTYLTGSVNTNAPYLDPWVAETTLAGRALLGYGKVTDVDANDARRMVLPFDVEGTTVTFGEPTYVGDPQTAWTYTYREPTFVAPQMVAWAQTRSGVDSMDFFVGGAGTGGSDDNAAQVTSSVPVYSILDVLTLSTESTLSGSLADRRIDFDH